MNRERARASARSSSIRGAFVTIPRPGNRIFLSGRLPNRYSDVDSAPRRAVPPTRLPPVSVQSRVAVRAGDGANAVGSWKLDVAAARRGARGRRVRAVLPGRQALREAEVRDRDRQRARRARRGAGGDGAVEAVLPPAALHAHERRSGGGRALEGRRAGAGGGAPVGPSL